MAEESAALPSLTITWNPEAQDVTVKFDPAHFKTWNFVLACLEMAKLKTRFQKQLADGLEMQKAMRQAEAQEKLLRRIALP